MVNSSQTLHLTLSSLPTSPDEYDHRQPGHDDFKPKDATKTNLGPLVPNSVPPEVQGSSAKAQIG